MGIMRAVFFCVVLYNAVGVHALGNDLSSRENPTEDGRPRVSHRVQMLFPLLLGISTRLATLIPTAIMGLIGIFLFVAFSKKAFIISLLALFLTYLDKHKRDEESVVHIHKINLYNEDEIFSHNYELLRHGSPVHKRFTGVGYVSWPRVFHRLPYHFKPSQETAGFGSRGHNRTLSIFFRELLPENIDIGGAWHRYH